MYDTGDGWVPTEHSDNQQVNALYNIAEAIEKLAKATDNLLYGLKYSKQDGMSIAEAVDVAGGKIAEATSGLALEVTELAKVLEDKE